MKFTLKRVLAVVTMALGIVFLAGVAYIRHESAQIPERFGALAQDLRTLRPGVSDWRLAKTVAERHSRALKDGSAYIRDPDCVKGYFERCQYEFFEAATVVGGLSAAHPWSAWVGGSEARARASVTIEKGIVRRYAFWMNFRTRDGQQRAVEVDVDADDNCDWTIHGMARVTDTYTVRRNEMLGGEWGLFLGASLASSAPVPDTRRAWDLSFGCLARPSGCGEVCDVMPSAWEDYYRLLGREAARKLGDRYQLCWDQERLKRAK